MSRKFFIQFQTVCLRESFINTKNEVKTTSGQAELAVAQRCSPGFYGLNIVAVSTAWKKRTAFPFL